MDLGALVQNLGFPIAVAVFFIWRDYQTSKTHMQDMRDIAVKAVQAIDKSTGAIEDQIKEAEKCNDVISNNSHILQRVEGVLLSRGQSNERSGVN